jgi:hypothetical protein
VASLSQIIDGPARDVIARIDCHVLQLRRWHCRILPLQLFDDLKVIDHGAQFRRGAQLKPRAFVNIQWFIKMVGLNSQAPRGQGSSRSVVPLYLSG